MALRWVCVPAHPGALSPGAEPRVRIELRERDGERVAVAFSSVARLVAELGDAQPWMVMDADRLRSVLAAAGVREMVVDPDLGSSAGRWRAEDVRGLAGGGPDG